MSLLNLVAKLTLDTSEYESSLGKAESSAGGFGNAFKKVADIGIKAFTAATAAVGAFTVASVKTGMDFDKSMSQVAATMGMSMSEMESEIGSVDLAWGHFSGNLRDYAQEMGANTAFSAKQSADALNYMALAGYKTQEAMEMLPNVMSLASAGAMDLARASDMVTDTQTAFGLKIEEMPQLIDEMAKAASTGNTSVEQLGDAFLTVGGLAQELNGGIITLSDGTEESVSGIQEMEIALTAMANAGVKGSEAGTHMRNMLLKLSSPTEDGAAQMEALGVSVFDAEGNMRSLKDIMGDLNGAFENLTQEQKINAIADLFNTRDMAAAEALLGAVEQDWDKIGESILDAEGAAKKMADTQLDNLAGDLTLFQSAVEGAQIAVSDKLSPSLREFVQTGTDGISEFTSKMRGGDFIGAIESIGNTVGQLATEAIKKVPDMVRAGAALLQGLGNGIAGAVSQIDFRNDVVPLIVSLAAGIRSNTKALVSAGIELIKNLGDGIQSNSSYLIVTGHQILDSIVGVFFDNAPALLEAGLGMIQNLGEGISENIPSFLEYVLPMIEQFSEFVREGAGQLVDTGIDFILNIAQGIMDSLPMLIEQVPQIIINFAGAINDNAPKLLVGGVKLIATIIQGIISAIPTLLANIPQIFQAVLAVWSALNWVNLGKNVITFVKNGIEQLQTQVPQTIKDIGAKAIEWFKGVNWANAGQQAINFIKTAITGLASLIPNAIKAIASTAVNWFKGIDWANAGITAINLIKSAINALFSNIPNALVSIGNSAVSAFKSIDWWDVGSNVISGIVNGIKSGIGWIKDAAKDAAQSALNAAKNLLGIESPSKVFRDEVGKMITAGLSIGIDDGAVDVIDSVERLSEGLFRPFDNLESPVIGNSSSDSSGMSQIEFAELIGTAVYEAVTDAMQNSGMSMQIDGREFGRIIRDTGVAIL